MNSVILLTLFAFALTNCTKFENKLISPKLSPKCKNIKCPSIEEPVCVKLKYKKGISSGKATYVLMVNLCELEYMKCHQDVDGIMVPLKHCNHKPPKQEKPTVHSRSKRSARVDAKLEEEKFQDKKGVDKKKDGVSLQSNKNNGKKNVNLTRKHLNTEAVVQHNDGGYREKLSARDSAAPGGGKSKFGRDRVLDEKMMGDRMFSEPMFGSVQEGGKSSGELKKSDNPDDDATNRQNKDGGDNLEAADDNNRQENDGVDSPHDPDENNTKNNDGGDGPGDPDANNSQEKDGGDNPQDPDENDKKDKDEGDNPEDPDENNRQDKDGGDSPQDPDGRDRQDKDEGDNLQAPDENNSQDKDGGDKSQDDENKRQDNKQSGDVIDDKPRHGGFSGEDADWDEYDSECPTVCPSRGSMVCARCKEGVYRTFLSVCHLRMFACNNPDEHMDLVARTPCAMSAPYIAPDMNMEPQGRAVPPGGDEDVVHKFVKCMEQPQFAAALLKETEGDLDDDEPKKILRLSDDSKKCEFNEMDKEVLKLDYHTI